MLPPLVIPQPGATGVDRGEIGCSSDTAERQRFESKSIDWRAVAELNDQEWLAPVVFIGVPGDPWSFAVAVGVAAGQALALSLGQASAMLRGLGLGDVAG
jgi:hypothetical protein